MEEFLEECDNPIIQVLNEFLILLYVLRTDSKKDSMLHSVFMDSKKIHIRAVCDFFKNTRHQDDDLIYKDFVDSQVDLSIAETTQLRRFINKSTAHITSQRGKMSVPEEDLLAVSISLIQAIYCFLEELQNHLKPEYKDYYQDDRVPEMEASIMAEIITIELINQKEGVNIPLCN